MAKTPTNFTEKGHCKDLLERFSSYLDAELDSSCCEQLERHLAECPECVETMEGVRRFITLCRQASSEEAIPPPADAFRARLRKRLLEIPPDEA